MDVSAKIRVRFGVYLADLSTGELYRDGLKVRIQHQPFRILSLLLVHPGEVVTRDQIRNELWERETFVDFEQGLNNAVRRLRFALRDSAENPRFVETLPKIGYRFIAPVERVTAEPVPPAASPPLPRRKAAWAVYGLLAGVLVAGVALAVRWRPDRLSHPTLRRVTSEDISAWDSALSPDGGMVAYIAASADRRDADLFVKQREAAEPVALTGGPANESAPSFSPDGTQIVYRSERDGGGIYIIPAMGGKARLVAPGGHQPSFSPDGRWIAYRSGDGGGSVGIRYIEVVPVLGGSARRLPTGLAGIEKPLWSPDSRWLLVAGTPPNHLGQGDWYLIPADGGPAIRTNALARIGGNYFGAPQAWVGGFVYYSLRTGDSVNIWRIPLSPDGKAGDPERVTFGAGYDMGASVATVTRPLMLAFQQTSGSANLYTVPLDANHQPAGAAAVLLAEGAARTRPSVSKDGRWLTYTARGFDSSPEVHLRDMLSGASRRLDTGGGVAFSAMTPDGSHIAFTRLERPAGEVLVVAREAGQPQVLCQDCGRAEHWAPDGRLLATVSNRDARSMVEVWDTGRGRRVSVLSHPEWPVHAPRFSTDGQWLLFHATTSPAARTIFVAPLRDGHPGPPSAWIALTSGDQLDREPCWSPSGDAVFFLSDRDGFRCIWTQRLDRRTLQPVGAPAAVHHVHHASLRLGLELDTGLVGLTALPGKLFFTLFETRGSIWLAQFERD